MCERRYIPLVQYFTISRSLQLFLLPFLNGSFVTLSLSFTNALLQYRVENINNRDKKIIMNIM